MTELYPIFFATIVIIILSGIEILFVRLLNRRWWQKTWIRRGSFFLPLWGLVSIIVWSLGLFYLNKTIMIIGSFSAAVTLILILALLLSLPISGAFNFVHDWLERRKRRSGKPETERSSVDEVADFMVPRRRFLKAAAAIAPLTAVSSGLSGVTHAFTDVKVYKRELYLPNLPKALDGFKILHLSDIHIGYYVWLDQVTEVMERARAYKPDILLATGDLSDRLDVYADLLHLFDQFEAPYKAYSSIGNHEYYRGFREVAKAYDRSATPLLLNQGVALDVNGQSIYLAGADDPRYLSRKDSGFFRNTLNAALASAPSDAFTILLSHRPESFDYAAQIGVDLVLAGHHHGTQIGFGGRSVFESVMPEKYLWGVYSQGSSRLYTSAGVGHWFPFRLGCPAEAPVLELKTLL